MRRSLRDRAFRFEPLYPSERRHRCADLQEQLADVNGTRLCALDGPYSGVVLMADGGGYFGGHGAIVARLDTCERVSNTPDSKPVSN